MLYRINGNIWVYINILLHLVHPVYHDGRGHFWDDSAHSQQFDVLLEGRRLPLRYYRIV